VQIVYGSCTDGGQMVYIATCEPPPSHLRAIFKPA
jgi:hypothetical protein